MVRVQYNPRSDASLAPADMRPFLPNALLHTGSTTGNCTSARLCR